MKRKFDNRLKCCRQSTTKFCSSSEKISWSFICLKIFLNNFIWTQGRISDNYAKKRQKTKTMLNVWKSLFTGNFSEKRVLPQKVALETLSPVLINLLTISRQKSVFSTNLWKTPPRPCPSFWKKLSNWTIFQEKIFPGEMYLNRKRHNFDNLLSMFEKHLLNV